MFKRILVPLDRSLLSECVLPYVRTLAGAWGSTVQLVHAIEAHDSGVGMGEQYLKGAAAGFPSAVRVEITVRSGAPAEVIIDTADDRADTLIAMSTRGTTGLQRWLLGSVADKVLRAARCPLLLMHGGRDSLPSTAAAIDQIILPLDGSPASEVAFDTAVGMARTLALPLLLVRCVPPIAGADEDEPALSEIAAGRDEAEGYLSEKTIDASQQGAEGVSHRVLWGSPANELIDLAQRHPASLTVMSTHGRSGIRRWALGSVTDRVVRHTHQPVLIVRADLGEGSSV